MMGWVILGLAAVGAWVLYQQWFKEKGDCSCPGMGSDKGSTSMQGSKKDFVMNTRMLEQKDISGKLSGHGKITATSGPLKMTS